MTATAVVTAAGTGVRFGHTTPKQFLSIHGVPMLVHTLLAFEQASSIHRIVISLPESELGRFGKEERTRFGLKKVERVIPGGATRQASVGLGLEAIEWPCDIAAIHDAARCLITPELIDESISALSGWDGAIVALPVRDTLKRVEGEKILKTEPREGLWAMQTPQVFRFPWIRDAYRNAQKTGFSATDDAAVAERFGGKIRVVQGTTSNVKITYPEDLALAELLLSERNRK